MTRPAPVHAAPEAQPGGTLLLLAAGTALVVALDVTVKALPVATGVRPWFDAGLENNVPTAWTVLLLLVLAQRLWRSRAVHWTWRAAAASALLLAVDEWVGWHEHLRVAGQALRSVGLGLPTYAWVLPGVALAAAAVAAATPWLRSLPADVARRTVAAVLVFCGGALGVEAVSGLAYHLGAPWAVWAALTSAEEALEMAGVVLAVSAFGRPPAPVPAAAPIARAQRG